MTTCKTGAEHIKSLKDGRTVYIDGKLVADVTEHPAFRNSVKSAAMLYDFQAQPENIELMTFEPNGVEPPRQPLPGRCRATTPRWCSGAKPCRLGPRSPTASWAARPTTSPPRWSASAWASRCSRSTGRTRAKALRDYFEEASRNDYFLTYVIINPQAERAKDWGEQKEELVARIVDEDAGGITIRGAKMLGTARSWRTRCSSRTCSR